MVGVKAGDILKRRGFSLRVKITVLFMLIFCPIILGVAVINISYERNAIRESLIEKGTIIARTGAVTTGHTLAQAIENGSLTEAQVFDTEYLLIPNSSPARYHTAYDHFTDRVLGPLFDHYLDDDVVLYATATDRNGYAPTHNSVFAQGELDDFANRSKRIFDDDVGLAAAMNEVDGLVQEYRRDTGESVWDVSAPVYVNDRHWGAFRVGLSPESAERAMAAAFRQSVLTAGAVLLVLAATTLVIAGAVARPIELLRRAVEKAGSGDFSQRITVDFCRELRSLSVSFNQMAEDLERQSQTEWLQKSALEDANRKLREMVVTDELTGARSRKYLFDRLQEEINAGQRTGKKLSVIFFDIDGFKQINDRCGHRAGDLFLVELISGINKLLRPYDILARYGGDEFVILSPGTSYSSALELAERVRRETAEKAFQIEGRLFKVTLSLGLVSVEKFEAESAEKVIDRLLVEADNRAYQAKRQGGNRVV